MTRDISSIFGGRLPASFERRRVVLQPGTSRPYVDEEWRDALVTVDSGDLEIECLRGGSRTFSAGDILWFSDLGLRTMRNRGLIPTVLISITRRG